MSESPQGRREARRGTLGDQREGASRDSASRAPEVEDTFRTSAGKIPHERSDNKSSDN